MLSRIQKSIELKIDRGISNSLLTLGFASLDGILFHR